MPFRDDIKPQNLLALEAECLERWESEGTFERSMKIREGAPRWVFYEGPPTANGKPGMHHVLARSVKDLACRLHTMKGFLVERRAGWDTHGLPVEISVEKALGLNDKKAVEAYGVERFNEACRDSVFSYLKDWNELTWRMGYWCDQDNPYITLKRDYMESLWWILSEFHRRDILFRGHKVLPYCPRCSTPLSSHEVGLGYQDVQDPSVFVRFRRSDGEGDFLVWTTTPWTLPANTAIAVHPDVDYVQVEVTGGDHKGTTLWVAAARRSALGVDHKVIQTVAGNALEGVTYERMFDWYDATDGEPLRGFRVVVGDFVTTSDGTGFVHMAPAFGQDDNNTGRREGLSLIQPLDDQGRFVAGSPVAGLFIKDADKPISRELKQRGAMWKQETCVHSYPHCWRCDSPLIYMARSSWYLRTTAFRDDMIKSNERVTWWPKSVGTGRFGRWLEGNVDWAISRDRYWGTPLPIWVCSDPDCKHEEAIGDVKTLETHVGHDVPDLHRPYVDELTWACAHEGCRGTMKRTPEVADAWFDSGSMPFAQWHYPFENKEKVEVEHPAAFISEGVDQTRGWFYTLLAVSQMLVGKPAYERCASLDLLLDSKGKKMSKSRGNVTDPIEIMSAYGADIARWHLLVRPLGTPLRYDENDLREIRNRLFGTLLNTYSFFATYANIDGYDATKAYDLPAERPVLDRWLEARVEALVRDVDRDMDEFHTLRAGKRIADFVVEDLSNWYVRRNRRRFFRADLSPDKRSAYAALSGALQTVLKLMAPFTPFIADTMYRALRMAEEPQVSVHLESWPTADTSRIDEALDAGMAGLRRVVSLGHAARDDANVRVRQPLGSVQVWGLRQATREFLERNEAIATSELNVKHIEFLSSLPDSCELGATLDKREAARRLGKQTPVVSKALEALSAADVAALLRSDAPTVRTPDGEVTLKPSDIRVVAESRGDAQAEFGGGVVVLLDTKLTPALRREGLAREVLRKLQQMRKDDGFRVEDRVRATWYAEGELADAIGERADWLASEILAVDFAKAEGVDGLATLQLPGEAKAWAKIQPL